MKSYLAEFPQKYNGKDAIGDLLQEWLAEWLKQKNFYFRTWQKKYRELMDLLKDN